MDHDSLDEDISISADLVENQQLGYRLVAQVRTLKEDLRQEKQSKRLLAVTNATLESQLRKAEQRIASLDQALASSERRRVEVENEREHEVNNQHSAC